MNRAYRLFLDGKDTVEIATILNIREAKALDLVHAGRRAARVPSQERRREKHPNWATFAISPKHHRSYAADHARRLAEAERNARGW